MSELNNMHHTRLRKGDTQRIPIGKYIYTVTIVDFNEYIFIAKEVIL